MYILEIIHPKVYLIFLCVGDSEDYLFALAKNLLSLESPTRGKFILLSTLSQHLPTHQFLKAAPQLPSELLSVMGHQALACHVIFFFFFFFVGVICIQASHKNHEYQMQSVRVTASTLMWF